MSDDGTSNGLPPEWADADPAGPWMPVGGEGDSYTDDDWLLIHGEGEGEFIEGEPVEVRL